MTDGAYSNHRPTEPTISSDRAVRVTVQPRQVPAELAKAIPEARERPDYLAPSRVSPAQTPATSCTRPSPAITAPVPRARTSRVDEPLAGPFKCIAKGTLSLLLATIFCS